MSPDTTHWAATYYDGKTAKPHQVRVTIQRNGLRIRKPDNTTIYWEYPQLTQTQGRYAGEAVRLEKGGELGEALVVREPGFLQAIREVAPEAKFATPAGTPKVLFAVVGGGLAVVGLGAGMYLWGLPAMAEAVTRQVPVSWEEKLGQAVVDRLVPAEDRCSDAKSLAALNRIVARLTAGSPSPYTYRVTISKEDTVNAFAAPGGYIVVCQGLLSKTTSPEMLAGVLAHEIQHVQKRHTTRAIMRTVSMQVLLTAMTGDAGALGHILSTAGDLGALSFQRKDEEEADREGMKLMQTAKIDTQGMIGAFRMLEEEGADLPDALQFLSTHPNTADRIQKLETMARSTRFTPVALESGNDWRRISGSCR